MQYTRDNDDMVNNGYGKKKPKETAALKITHTLNIPKKCDMKIQRWATKSGYLSGNPLNSRLMDENMYVYCFYKRFGHAVACVGINILDEEIRIEAWMVDEISEARELKASIDGLMNTLSPTRNGNK